jgi:starch-binding outer membrane protein, SusD/RagB family
MKMKNKLFLIGLLTATLLSSCSDEFLEPKNYNSLLSNTFYTDTIRLKTATFGVYKILQSNSDFASGSNRLYGYDMWAFADVSADLVDARNLFEGGQNPGDIQRGIQTPSNATLSKVWPRNYAVVRRANDVINNIPSVPNMSDALRNKYEGELRFLRALAYFNLIRTFGGRPHVPGEDQWGIPMMTEAVTSIDQEYVKPRGTVSEAYDYIIDDLTFAGNHLPAKWSADNTGRATKGAAWALLAKVYMTQAGTSGNIALWDKALEYAQKVMDLNLYGLFNIPGVLNNPYATLFRIPGENSVESIFEIQQQARDYGFGESYNNILAPSSRMAANNKGFVYPTQGFVDMYEEGDLRRQASIFMPGDQFYPEGSSTPLADYTYQPSGLTGYHTKKFVSGTTNMWETGPANIRLLRFAEILLIKAEALNAKGNTTEAYEFVNQVRSRAGLDGLPEGLSQAGMREAIWRERALEFFMEVDRWFDLKRTDQLLTQMQWINSILPTSYNNPANSELNFVNNFNSDKHYIMPIPQGEIDLTNGVLVQAPGY